MVTVRWLSAAVKKIWLFFVGMTVLRVMSLVMTPPTVSMPSVSGLTSSSTRSVSASGQIRISEESFNQKNAVAPSTPAMTPA